jgi:hypothetical protein
MIMETRVFISISSLGFAETRIHTQTTNSALAFAARGPICDRGRAARNPDRPPDFGQGFDKRLGRMSRAFFRSCERVKKNLDN